LSGPLLSGFVRVREGRVAFRSIMTKLRTITFRLSEEESEMLGALAEELDRSKSWLIREIVFGDFFVKYHSGILGAASNIRAQHSIERLMKGESDD
tara:strand:- start:205 stop:492 length:288 start_codon:yes stop_codon:yes gene_type:complete